jgi:hypothetical protein
MREPSSGTAGGGGGGALLTMPPDWARRNCSLRAMCSSLLLFHTRCRCAPSPLLVRAARSRFSCAARHFSSAATASAARLAAATGSRRASRRARSATSFAWYVARWC